MTYFIADIAANHDGNIKRAFKLIRLAKEAGADCAKFQHFQADKIVSDAGFKRAGKQSHQASWKESVYEVYKKYSVPADWTEALKNECDRVGIDFMSTPYDKESVDILEPYVDMYKIGSGDITWLSHLEYIAKKGKPIILSTGASTLEEVEKAVDTIWQYNSELTLLQCNTSYTAEEGNFDHVNLNVLETFKANFHTHVGLSDHTGGHIAVLGAVAKGATVIEKHFTDNTKRTGPDHKFSLTPETWRKMVDDTRVLERTLGSYEKFICDNEKQTYYLQRRAVRATRDIKQGEAISPDMVKSLRPYEKGALEPFV